MHISLFQVINKNTYALMQETSENICREYRLLVLNERDYYKKRQENYKANDKYTNLVKEDIDFAIGQAVNYLLL